MDLEISDKIVVLVSAARYVAQDEDGSLVRAHRAERRQDDSQQLRWQRTAVERVPVDIIVSQQATGSTRCRD